MKIAPKDVCYTMQLDCRSMFRLLVFAFIGSGAFAQNSESVTASTVPKGVTPSATIPAELDLVDQVLGMVGPSEPSHLTECVFSFHDTTKTGSQPSGVERLYGQECISCFVRRVPRFAGVPLNR